MNIIKLDAIDSTNNYFKKIILNEAISDYTVVTAKFQTEGKGQLGLNGSQNILKTLFAAFIRRILKLKCRINLL